MILWLDAHLSPLLAPWIAEKFNCECTSFRDLGFRSASDRTVYFAARERGAIIVSKDSDFVDLLRQHGPPPKVIWVRCGNRSNLEMQRVFEKGLGIAVDFLETESLITIRDQD